MDKNFHIVPRPCLWLIPFICTVPDKKPSVSEGVLPPPAPLSAPPVPPRVSHYEYGSQYVKSEPGGYEGYMFPQQGYLQPPHTGHTGHTGHTHDGSGLLHQRNVTAHAKLMAST